MQYCFAMDKNRGLTLRMHDHLGMSEGRRLSSQFPPWVKGGYGRQVDDTAGLPPASDYPVGSHTYASCNERK
jgi:hypothetical protein